MSRVRALVVCKRTAHKCAYLFSVENGITNMTPHRSAASAKDICAGVYRMRYGHTHTSILYTCLSKDNYYDHYAAVCAHSCAHEQPIT